MTVENGEKFIFRPFPANQWKFRCPPALHREGCSPSAGENGRVPGWWKMFEREGFGRFTEERIRRFGDLGAVQCGMSRKGTSCLGPALTTAIIQTQSLVDTAQR